MRRQRAARTDAAADRRAMGPICRLDSPVDRGAAAPGAAAGRAIAQWCQCHVRGRRPRTLRPSRRRRIPAGTCRMRGKAWSGTGPVTSVEISLTGEGEWHPAELEPPRGRYQWQDWSFGWQTATVGRHTLRARATDAAGNTQPETPPLNRLRYGNNAIEM